MDTRRPLVLLAIAVAFAVPLPAQIPGGTFTGAPFSATETTERIQTLADGTHITQPGRAAVMYRDSAGRTRNEVTYRSSQTGEALVPAMVTITDPVAGYKYQLDASRKIAFRFALQHGTPPADKVSVEPPRVVGGRVILGGGAAGVGPNAPANRPKETYEKLGSQVIEGVTTEGTRSTTTWAVGAIGNDREISVTDERWNSSQLRMPVLAKTSDPRTGDVITKLANINLSEPDPTLFILPINYTVKDGIDDSQ